MAEKYENKAAFFNFGRQQKWIVDSSSYEETLSNNNNNTKVSDNMFSAMFCSQRPNDEYQYLSLIERILGQGSWEDTRNGRTKSVFGESMRFSLRNGTIPILTTKKTAWKTCLKELLWFIRGDTNSNNLKKEGVKIWDANASSEFRKTVGLDHYPEGELGPIYGFQWRHFNGNYSPESNSNGSEIGGIDQLQGIINSLKDPAQRTSRRLLMVAWNPSQLGQMVLPPCHVLCQFNVHDGNNLSCSLYQRSGDVGLGVPFNIASYSFLTHLLAKHCGLDAYEFVYFLGNAHIYDDHVDQLTEQVARVPFELPTINVREKRDNIEDYIVDDFELSNYTNHASISMEMRK